MSDAQRHSAQDQVTLPATRLHVHQHVHYCESQLASPLALATVNSSFSRWLTPAARLKTSKADDRRTYFNKIFVSPYTDPFETISQKVPYISIAL